VTSADRERNHDMTHRDIALLLAEAADEVEIGIAPTQAVIRGGRRRRARRWRVAAATAMVVAGSTGALAVTGLPGGQGHVEPAATRPPATGTQNEFEPAGAALLATGTDAGRPWSVSIDVWPAPRDATEARAMLNAMRHYGENPTDIRTPSELVGKSAYFVRRSVGVTRALGGIMSEGTTTKADTMSGTDIEAAVVPLDPHFSGPDRLVVGHVAKTAQRVTCTWKDGSTTEVGRAPANGDINSDEDRKSVV
jgi:hypothetical protein